MLGIEHIHPIAVHFPIVLVLLLAAFDAGATLSGVLVSGRGCAANVSASLAALAGLAAVVAFVFGDIAFDAAVARDVPEATLETHEGLGTITAIAVVLWAVLRAVAWWRQIDLGGWRRGALLAVEVAIAALIVVTAYFGGALVYQHGVNVLG